MHKIHKTLETFKSHDMDPARIDKIEEIIGTLGTTFSSIRNKKVETPAKKVPKFVYYKTQYAVLFQIWTFPSKPEDEAHISPTVTYDKVIYPGFQHDITALQIQRIRISYNRHTSA